MRIELDGAKNTRDLGGIPAANGRLIKKHRLIRSGVLSHITPTDVSVLQQCRLKRVIDFRVSAELRQRPDVQIDGVEYISLPLVSEQIMGVTREKNVIEQMIKMARIPGFCAEKHMQNIYSDFVRGEFSPAQLRKFFSLLLNECDGAVLWHCTAGKDRVGVATALLLTILGADEDTIFADYMRTNDFVAADVSDAVQAVALRLNGEFSAVYITDMVTTLYTVQKSHLRSVFDTMKHISGNVETYLREVLGITPDIRDQFRKLYLEP
ncbi:MAG: tyrosine-protein phosphatase [Christensenellaceae bacterium]|nr:tyrosine-protein phosphatase [Christensenellaceae bacterium]